MECIENFIKRDQPYLTPASSLEEAGRIFRSSNVSQLSIIDSEEKRHPVGILNEHGLMGRCMEKHKNISHIEVKECMQSVPLVISSEMDPEYCYLVMTQHNLEQAPVIDKDGKYIGEILLEEIPLDD